MELPVSTMTMMSTILGSLPLILSAGAGAEARHSIGWVVFGGLGLAAAFTLYLTPALYSLLAPFSKARASVRENSEGPSDRARTTWVSASILLSASSATTR